MWYYFVGGSDWVGPVSFETLMGLVSAGQVKPNDLVSHNGLRSWNSAKNFPRLNEKKDDSEMHTAPIKTPESVEKDSLIVVKISDPPDKSSTPRRNCNPPNTPPRNVSAKANTIGVSPKGNSAPQDTKAICPFCKAELVPASFLDRHISMMHRGKEDDLTRDRAKRFSRSVTTSQGHCSSSEGRGSKSAYPYDCCQTCGVYLVRICYSMRASKNRVPRKDKICTGCFCRLHPELRAKYFEYHYAYRDVPTIPSGQTRNP